MFSNDSGFLFESIQTRKVHYFEAPHQLLMESKFRKNVILNGIFQNGTILYSYTGNYNGSINVPIPPNTPNSSNYFSNLPLHHETGSFNSIESCTRRDASTNESIKTNMRHHNATSMIEGKLSESSDTDILRNIAARWLLVLFSLRC